MRAKVFCIGFHKTGTSSLGKALESLGYRNVHGAGVARKKLGDTLMMRHLFERNLQPFFEIANEFDSFNDNPWFKIYQELDAEFPNSKFILMLRNEQEWIESCLRYFGDSESAFRFWIYGKKNPKGNEQTYLRVYRKHNKEVMNYFKNRKNDLLIIHLEDEHKMQKIAAFLDVPLQGQQFPKLNTTK